LRIIRAVETPDAPGARVCAIRALKGVRMLLFDATLWRTWRQRRINRSFHQRNLEALYSAINWRSETRDLIVGVAIAYSAGAVGRWIAPSLVETPALLRIDLYSDDLDRSHFDGETTIPEGPASLIYYLHPSGGIAVFACSHDLANLDSRGSKATARHYIIDFIANSGGLTGAAGRDKVRTHLLALSRLSCSTMARALPTPARGRFLRRIRARSWRLETFLDMTGEPPRVT
jgi:hypothetical protein